MPKCSICSHPKRRQIDRAIAYGQRNVAEQFQVSRSAVCRHRHHITEAILTARVVEQTEAVSLLEQVRQVAADARRITALAEKRGKLSIALGGLREMSRNLELIGRLSGELHSGTAVNVGVGVSNLTAAEEQLIARHRAFESMDGEERQKHSAELQAEIARIEAELVRHAAKPTRHSF